MRQNDTSRSPTKIQSDPLPPGDRVQRNNKEMRGPIVFLDRDILLRIPLSIVCKCNTNGQNSGGGRGRGMHVSAALVREEAIFVYEGRKIVDLVSTG